MILLATLRICHVSQEEKAQVGELSEKMTNTLLKSMLKLRRDNYPKAYMLI